MTNDRTSVPTISESLDDGTLVELVYDPAAGETSFAVRRADGLMGLETQYELPNGTLLAPYSATNNLIATGCVLLPSALGEHTKTPSLAAEVRAFLHRYVDLSPLFEQIATYYVILTWVYDAFSDLPYLRFRGDFGTGKTRALLTVGSLCYKPFHASGASTVSPIFHIQDAFQGTLILDEADFRFTDSTSELIKVLNNGTTRGLPVLRTMTNRNRELNPTAFRVFGPKIVAMRESFADLALESRFLTEDTGRAPREDIPVHLPATFHDEARALRNRLLTWRFQNRNAIAADPSRLDPDLAPRRKQSALALLSLIDDEELRRRIQEHLSHQQASDLVHRGSTEEARLTRATLESFEASTASSIQVAQVATRYNADSDARAEVPLSAKRIGWLLRNRLQLTTSKSNGVYVVMQSERPAVEARANRLGLVRLEEAPLLGEG